MLKGTLKEAVEKKARDGNEMCKDIIEDSESVREYFFDLMEANALLMIKDPTELLVKATLSEFINGLEESEE